MMTRSLPAPRAAGPSRRTRTAKCFFHASILVEGSPLYEGPHGLLVLPLGHYTVTLEHAPAGFSPVNDVLSFDVTARGRAEVEPLLNFEPLEETLAVMRGDVMFRKVDEAGMTLAGIPFLLSYANGEGPDLIESHVLVTNEHGDFTSSAERIPHTIDTNRSDAAILANIDGVYKLDETKLTGACGTWFSMDAMGMTSSADDTRGALPYGSYLLQELPCAANAGANLISTQFSINRDNFTVKLDNIVNTRPGVSGSATDAADADKLIRPIENAIVSESIDYRNLVIAKSYRVNCSAFVQSTGESVPGPRWHARLRIAGIRRPAAKRQARHAGHARHLEARRREHHITRRVCLR